jgi:serine/threonine protein kinase/tetratricopeptide (TPR) repeat protein
MLKVIEEQFVAEGANLDSVVKAFEQASFGEQPACLDDFLPDPSHPQYLNILRELIRLEMEFSWSRGIPHRLNQYRDRFPEVFDDSAAVQEIAYEEYRLRLASGERPAVSEYEKRYYIDCSDWPAAEEHIESPLDDRAGAPEISVAERLEKRGVEGGSEPEGEMREAALAYTVFRLNSGDSPAERSEKEWSESVLSASVAGGLFRELHEANPESACRLAMAASVMPECGSKFLDFELESELGRGAFGRVFLARQASLAGRQVALKITAEKSVESRALAQMQHTHIVPVYSVHRSGPFHAVVMPYFGSVTLADLLRDAKGQETRPQSGTALVSTLNIKQRDAKSRSPGSVAALATMRPFGTVTDSEPEALLAPEPLASPERSDSASSEVLRKLGNMTYNQGLLWIGARIADALAHAHERGILHRDLKPANILFTDQGPMLLDFNLAADTKGAAEATVAKLGGTLPYMAPEHLEAFRNPARSVDGRCDIYSLGVVMYELLSGRRPFATPRGPVKEALDEMIRDRDTVPASLCEFDKDISPAVDAIVRKCLQADPAARYQTVRQLHEDLQRQLNDQPLLHIPEPSLKERAGKWVRRNRKNILRVAAAAAVAAVFGLGGLAVHIERDRQRTNEINARVRAANKQQVFAKSLRLTDGVASLNRGVLDSKEIAKARVAAETLLEDYSVLSNPEWQAAPDISNLDSEKRAALLEDLGGVLVLLAQSRLAESRLIKTGDRHLDGPALLLDRAESCYENSQTPHVLWLMRAELAKLKGDKNAETEFLARAALVSPDSVLDRGLLASYQMSLGRVPLAVQLLKQLTERYPGNMMAWSYLGDGYLRLTRFSDAVYCYGVCIALAPDLKRYYFCRGLAYHRLGDFGKAASDFTEMLRRDPGDIDGLLNRSLAYSKLRNHKAALADLKTASALPEAPEARIHFMASEVLLASKDQDGARKEKELGIKANCVTELDWIARGNCDLHDDLPAAINDFDEALQVNPHSSIALLNKAIALAKIPGRMEEAVGVLNGALELYPSSADLLNARAIYLARLGQRDGAVRDTEACLRLDPRPMNRYMAADVYALCSRSHPEDAKRALGNLAAAFKGGIGTDLVPGDRDLDPIRKNPEFKQLTASAQVVREAALQVGVH